MIKRVPFGLVALALACLGTSVAAESTSDWLKRMLDPATIDVTPFPGSQLSKKISVDTIRHESPNKRIAVYMVDLGQLNAAAEYFTKTLQTEPLKTKDPRGFDYYRFVLDDEGKYPKKARGLTITVMRSPWVDGKAQIQMEYVPPK